MDEYTVSLVVTPPRKGMATTHSPQLLKAGKRLRKCIETVGSHLTERFAVARIRRTRPVAFPASFDPQGVSAYCGGVSQSPVGTYSARP